MDWEAYHGVDYTEEARRRQLGPYKVPKRYRKYNQKQREARAERIQEYREFNAERRRQRGSSTQGTE